MNSTQSTPKVAWGDETLWLKFPGFNAHFSGLNIIQKKQISEDYSDFSFTKEDARKSVDQDSTLNCDTYQINQRLDLPIDNLSIDGQYAPLKQRIENVVDITGVNFRASFSSNANIPDQASLGVATAAELAHPVVLENFLRIYTAHNAIALSGAVLHSAGLVFDQYAYIFVGYSGAGKTTLTRKAYRNGATVLSDDLNLILPSTSGFNAYKVPFTGEFGRTVDHGNSVKSYPVKAVILLEQADQIEVTLCKPVYAVSRLIAGSPFVNTDELEIKALIEIYTKLASELPIIKLAVPLDSSIDDMMSQINELIESL